MSSKATLLSEMWLMESQSQKCNRVLMCIFKLKKCSISHLRKWKLLWGWGAGKQINRYHVIQMHELVCRPFKWNSEKQVTVATEMGKSSQRWHLSCILKEEEGKGVPGKSLPWASRASRSSRCLIQALGEVFMILQRLQWFSRTSKYCSSKFQSDSFIFWINGG